MPTDRASILNKTFAQLTSAQQQQLAETLRPIAGFTEEQRSLMQDTYLEVPADRLSELTALNEGRSMTFDPRPVGDRHLLPVELLTDAREGETFYHARSFLFSLLIVEVLPGEFPVVEILI